MIKQKRTKGAIVEIDLKNGYYTYAQILDKTTVFFDFRTKEKLKNLEVLLESPVLFFLSVFRKVYTEGVWEKVGKLPIKKEFEFVPMQFMQDVIQTDRFQIYDPNTGEARSARKEEILGLERASVWEASHVEDRLRDYYEGKPNKWEEQLKPNLQ